MTSAGRRGECLGYFVAMRSSTQASCLGSAEASRYLDKEDRCRRASKNRNQAGSTSMGPRTASEEHMTSYLKCQRPLPGWANLLKFRQMSQPRQCAGCRRRYRRAHPRWRTKASASRSVDANTNGRRPALSFSTWWGLKLWGAVCNRVYF